MPSSFTTAAVVLIAAVVLALLSGWGSSSNNPRSGERGEAVQKAVEAVAAADALAASNKHDQAVRKYIEGIHLAGDELPAPEVVIYNLGLSFKSMGQSEQAVRSFNQSLMLLPDKLSPRAAEVHIQIAETCSSIGMWSCAATHFTSATSIQPSNAIIHFNLGSVLLNMGNTERNDAFSVAAIHFEKSLSLEPNRDDYRAHLAVALVKTSETANIARAQTLLQACLQNKDPELHIFVAFSIEELAPALTMAHLERCVEMDGGRKLAQHPQRTSIYYRLGRLYREAGRMEEEHALFEKALTLKIWQHPMQHPGFLRHGLAAVPFPAQSDEGFEVGAAGSPGAQEMWEAVKLLEANYEGIKREFSAAVELAREGRAVSANETASPASSLVSPASSLVLDNENIADSGSWRQLIFRRNGVWIEEQLARHRSAFPTTIQVLKALGDASGSRGQEGGSVGLGVAHALPKGSMEFSVLSGEAHLRPHCGPTNHRIRLHLGIAIPPPVDEAEAGAAAAAAAGAAWAGGIKLHESVPSIRVANKTRSWEEGRVLVLDDSFDHEVSSSSSRGEGART
jgi:tetratricopeptide (TPR) repeat protein